MKYAFSIVLTLLTISAFGQKYTKCDVYQYEVDDSLNRRLVKSQLYNEKRLLVYEIEYGKRDGSTDAIIYDTSYYLHKRYYYYNDTLLVNVMDCMATNKERQFADYWTGDTHVQYDIPADFSRDTIVTQYYYNAKGQLTKVQNSKMVKRLYHNSNGLITTDTVVATDISFGDLEIWADSSFARYTHFAKGYRIKRTCSDPETYRMDTFIYNKRKLIKHSVKQREHTQTMCENYVATTDNTDLYFYGAYNLLQRMIHYNFGKPWRVSLYVYSR